MSNQKIRSSVLLLSLFLLSLAACTSGKEAQAKRPEAELLFSDSGTGDWRDKWFLDGARATVINSAAGMELIAGPEARNDTCHAVLWTKQSFSGDISIAYEYTRTDSSTQFVNILYFLATGKGDEEYPTDITRWNDKRVVPHMRTYFQHLKTYHISYAAYGPDAGSAMDDYVRLRRYDPSRGKLKGTEIAGDRFATGLFRPGVTYHIIVTKRQGQIKMDVQNPESAAERMVAQWDVSHLPAYPSGRIGLRHMYTRSARYRNFRVWRVE